MGRGVESLDTQAHLASMVIARGKAIGKLTSFEEV